jgi:hypothetical protein
VVLECLVCQGYNFLCPTILYRQLIGLGVSAVLIETVPRFFCYFGPDFSRFEGSTIDTKKADADKGLDASILLPD